MPTRILARMLLAVALCAAPFGASAVTIPLATESGSGKRGLEVEISLDALSRRLASARMPGPDGRGPAEPNAGYGALAALVRTALATMPWLDGTERANGLWTWRRNPMVGVAIYGPGAGGYNSFSWSRKVPALPPVRPGAIAQVPPDWVPAAYQPAAARRGANSPPAPVPLPPAAPLLLAGLAALAYLRPRRK